MSILASELRSLIFSNLRDNINPKVKRAVWDLFNAVDSDLDVMGYTKDTCSSTTQEALEKFADDISGKSTIPFISDEDLLDAPEQVEVKKTRLEISDEDLQ